MDHFHLLIDLQRRIVSSLSPHGHGLAGDLHLNWKAHELSRDEGPVLLILYPDDYPRRIPYVCQRVHIPQLEKVIPCMAHGFPELGALGDLLPPVRAAVEMFRRVRARLAGEHHEYAHGQEKRYKEEQHEAHAVTTCRATVDEPHPSRLSILGFLLKSL